MFISVIKWFFILVLALISLVLIIPEGIQVYIDKSGVRLKVRLLYLVRFEIPSGKKKETSQGKDGKEKEEKKTEKKQEKSFLETLSDLGISSETISEFMKPFRGLMRSLGKTVVIDELVAQIFVCGSSPEIIGRSTGYVWAFISGVIGLLAKLFTVKVKSIDVIPNFSDSSEGEYSISFGVLASPVVLIAAAAVFGIRLFTIYRKYKKRTVSEK